MKKLFTLLYYLAAIAFAAVVFFAHIDLFKSVTSLKFSSLEEIFVSIGIIIILLVDVILFIRILFGVIKFLIHIGDKAKSSKKMIKCVSGIGGYFVSLMIASYIVEVFAAVGKEYFLDVVKSAATQEFYLPIAFLAGACIVLLVARIISRGGPISGIFVLAGVGLLVALNIIYYRDTIVDSITRIRFIVLMVALGLAVIPGFMPELGSSKTKDE